MSIIQRLNQFKSRYNYLPGKVMVALLGYENGKHFTIQQVEAKVSDACYKINSVLLEAECAGITLGEKAFLDEFKK